MIRTLVALLFSFQLSLAYATVASDIGTDTSLANATTAAQKARDADTPEDSTSIFNQLIDAGVAVTVALEAIIAAFPQDEAALRDVALTKLVQAARSPGQNGRDTAIQAILAALSRTSPS